MPRDHFFHSLFFGGVPLQPTVVLQDRAALFEFIPEAPGPEKLGTSSKLMDDSFPPANSSRYLKSIAIGFPGLTDTSHIFDRKSINHTILRFLLVSG